MSTTLLVILAGLIGAVTGYALAVFIAIQFFLPSVAAQDKVGFSMGIYLQFGPIGAVVGILAGVVIALLLKNYYQT